MNSSQTSDISHKKHLFLLAFFLVAIIAGLTENEIYKYQCNLDASLSTNSGTNSADFSDHFLDLIDAAIPDFAQNITSIQLNIKKNTIQLHHFDYYTQSDHIHSPLYTFSIAGQTRALVLRI